MLENSTSVIASKPGHKSPVLWKIFFITLASIVLLSAILNFVVDPFAIYGTGIFDSIEFNRYQHKYNLFRDFEPKPSALVIGSSRVTFLDPQLIEELTGERCFVWGCPDVRMEVEYAMLRIALEEFNAPIKLLIIGVEPEVFHPTKPLHPEVKIIDEYTKYFDKAAWWSKFSEKFSRLFTIEQTAASITVLVRTIQGRESERVFDFRQDGFPLLPDNVYAEAPERIREGILDYPLHGFGLEEFTGLSEQRKHYFEEILRICDERGIKVYAIMTPLHPDLVRRFTELGAKPIFDETAEYVSGKVGEIGGVFRDYTTIESFGGSPDYFLDAYHVTPPNGDILLGDLFSDYSE
jgi:hypothetical protein